MTDERPLVAVYCEHYLTITMTFIHRMICGVEREWRTAVLATRAANLQRFSCRDLRVFEGGAHGPLARAIARVAGGYTRLSPLGSRRLRAALRELGDARLLHAHFGPGGIQALPAARASRLPLLVTFHGYDASSLLRVPRYARDLRRLLAWQHTHVHAVSDVIARRLLEHGASPERLAVIRLGIPLAAHPLVTRRPPAEKTAEGLPLVILQVSGFTEKKGHVHAVRAFARIAPRFPSSRLVLAGDGPRRPAVAALVRELGLESRIALPGVVDPPQVPGLMAQADVFIHHSVTASDGDQEGIPTVVMEAMASGLPVVTTRHAGIPELVEDGRTGHLVEERDEEGTARALEAALTGGLDVGRNARRAVEERHSLDRQCEKLSALYHRIAR